MFDLVWICVCVCLYKCVKRGWLRINPGVCEKQATLLCPHYRVLFLSDLFSAEPDSYYDDFNVPDLSLTQLHLRLHSRRARARIPTTSHYAAWTLTFHGQHWSLSSGSHQNFTLNYGSRALGRIPPPHTPHTHTHTVLHWSEIIQRL